MRDRQREGLVLQDPQLIQWCAPNLQHHPKRVVVRWTPERTVAWSDGCRVLLCSCETFTERAAGVCGRNTVSCATSTRAVALRLGGC